MPYIEMIAASQRPPPMSTTMLPRGLDLGYAPQLLPPAVRESGVPDAAPLLVQRHHGRRAAPHRVAPTGMVTITSGLEKFSRPFTLLMKYRSMASVIV